MKKTILLAITICSSVALMATQHLIRNNGNSFSPDTLTINQGDTVNWVLNNVHNVVEVDSAVWASNGSTSNNGFSLPFGGGSHTFTSTGTYYYVCVPHSGSGMKGRIFVNFATSIKKHDLEPSFSFYPNPAHDQLKIEIPDGKSFRQLELMSIDGKLMESQVITSKQFTLDVAGFTPGSYILILRNTKGILSRKIVIQ